MITEYLTLGLLIPALLLQIITIVKSSTGRTAMAGAFVMTLLSLIIHGVAVYYMRAQGHEVLVNALLAFAGVLLLGSTIMNMSLLCSVSPSGYSYLVSNVVLIFLLFVLNCITLVLLLRKCPSDGFAAIPRPMASFNAPPQLQVPPLQQVSEDYTLSIDALQPRPQAPVQRPLVPQPQQQPLLRPAQPQQPLQLPTGAAQQLRIPNAQLQQVAQRPQQGYVPMVRGVGAAQPMIKRSVPIVSTNATPMY